MALLLLGGCDARDSMDWLSERHDLDTASCISRNDESVFVFFAEEKGINHVLLIETGQAGDPHLRTVHVVGFEERSGDAIPLSGLPTVIDHKTVEIGNAVFSYLSSFYPMDSLHQVESIIGIISVAPGAASPVNQETTDYATYDFKFVVRCEIPLRLDGGT